MTSVENSYDRIAAAYAARYADELTGKPFDRLMLDWLAERAPLGRLCDLGCGPGHVAAYLCAKGRDVCGIDLSPQFVETARRQVPGVEFSVGDMEHLDSVPDGSYVGIAAFYSIVHFRPEQLRTVFEEMHRVIGRGGGCCSVFTSATRYTT